MRKAFSFLYRYSLLVPIILGAYAFRAYGDYLATPGSGLTIVSFDGTHGGTSRCAAASTTCVGVTLQNSAGTEEGNATTPLQVSLANTGANGTALAVTAAQATAANLNATVVGTGTFSAQISQQTGWAGGTLGAMANYGTSPGAVLVPGVNAFITNTPNVAVTGSAAVTGAASAFVDGWNVTDGTKADTPCATPTSSTACSLIALAKAIANGVTSPVPLGTAGGWTPKRLSALSTTVTAIKSSAAGWLGLLHCNNANASVAYIQIFDVATTGGVTLGTTSPTLSFSIPATNATGFSLPVNGFQFANGIQVAATTTATGSTALGTALDCNAGFN